MPLWAYTAAAALAVGAGTGWKVRDWKADAADKERLEFQQKEAMRAADKVDWSAAEFEKGRAAASARERVVVREVQHVVEKPVYRELCLDADGLRILADDVDASNARRGLAPAVPAASAPG